MGKLRLNSSTCDVTYTKSNPADNSEGVSLLELFLRRGCRGNLP